MIEAIFRSGNAACNRSSRDVRSPVFEFPALGSRLHIKGMPMPFHITDIMRMLIVVLPKSQLVRSIANTQGLSTSPRRSITTRAAPLCHPISHIEKIDKIGALPSPFALSSIHTRPVAIGRSYLAASPAALTTSAFLVLFQTVQYDLISHWIRLLRILIACGAPFLPGKRSIFMNHLRALSNPRPVL